MIRWLLLVGVLVLFVAGCSSAAAPSASSPSSALSPPSAPSPPSADPVAELLAQQEWKPTGPREESTAQLPADFKLRSGFPWRIIVDFSLDVGLNLEPYAGQTVRMLIVPVEDLRGGRLDYPTGQNFEARIFLDPQSGQPVGAWVLPSAKDGEPIVLGIGHSLSGRELDEVTGISFFEYGQKHRATPPSPERLAAERPRNAIHDYFRAASQYDCGKLWALLTEKAKTSSAQQTTCDSYAPFASLRVIEVNGYAKADTPQGFRHVSIDEVADQYHVVVEVKHKVGERSAWREGIIRLLIPMVQEADGQWRLGLAQLLPVS